MSGLALWKPHRELFAAFTDEKRSEAIKAFCNEYNIVLADHDDPLLMETIDKQVEMDYLSSLGDKIENAYLIYMVDMMNSGGWMVFGAVQGKQDGWEFADYVQTYLASKRNHALDIKNLIERVLTWIDSAKVKILDSEGCRITTTELVIRGVPLYKMLKVSYEFGKLEFANEAYYPGLDKDAERRKLILLLAENPKDVGDLVWNGKFESKSGKKDEEGNPIGKPLHLSLNKPTIFKKGEKRTVTMVLDDDTQYYMFKAALQHLTAFDE